jgi:hypothetical protein
MKHKKQNPFDVLVENLINEFSKIKNFNLLSEDERGKQMFNFVTYRMSEITSMKALYANTFLPAVNRDIVESINQMKVSRYKAYFTIDKEQVKELYYDTIRMGYVQLFHRLENFYKDLLKMANYLFNQDSTITIETYYKEVYKVDIVKNWKKNFLCEKVNWVCNRVKHTDGFPDDNYPIDVSEFLHPKGQRLKIEKEEFINDIDFIQKFYITLMQIVFALSSYKMLISDFKVDDEFISSDLRKQMLEFEGKIQTVLDFYRN